MVVKFGWEVHANWKPFIVAEINEASDGGYPLMGLQVPTHISEFAGACKQMDRTIRMRINKW